MSRTVSDNVALAQRLQEIRLELFGEEGRVELARQLRVPERTWAHYESGVTLPAPFLLRFIEITGAEPSWLLHGQGSRYRRDAAHVPASLN